MDLCKASLHKYDTALSVVLGRNLEAIVVDEEKTAIDCIEYMRNQRAGQATFIPLDTIQVKPVNDKFRAFGKGVRLAVDIVQHEPAIERAIHHACGSALVCDSMEIARNVCYEKGQEVKGDLKLILFCFIAAEGLSRSSRYPGRNCHSQERTYHWWTKYACDDKEVERERC